jgi:hypothetical protein
MRIFKGMDWSGPLTGPSPGLTDYVLRQAYVPLISEFFTARDWWDRVLDEC